jgi:2-hydroxychromene-2-carboxylate isomerase
MSAVIEFIFDFASPNAYLAYRVLPEILARTGAVLALTPALLGGIFKATGNQAPMIAFGGVAGKMDYEMLEMRRFIARHGLGKFRMNPNFPINTLMLMRGLVAADSNPAYVEAVLRGMWEDGLNMGDPAVAAEVVGAAGLDAAAIFTAAGTDAVKQQLAANTQAAVARGVFGIPSFFVDGALFFGKDRLDSVERYLLTGVA